LRLNTNDNILVKADQARIVFKHTDAPIDRGEPSGNLLSGGKNSFLQQVAVFSIFDCRGTSFFQTEIFNRKSNINLPFQRLMRAVLRPGLGEGFQFDVSWVPTKFAKVLLNGAHLGEVQGELTVVA